MKNSAHGDVSTKSSHEFNKSQKKKSIKAYLLNLMLPMKTR